MIYTELYKNGYILEHRAFSHKVTGKNDFELTWSNRSPEANITFDLSLGIETIIQILLRHQQFSLLFYDKSILQVEYKIRDNKIIKQRMQFIKKSSTVKTLEELQELEGDVSEVEGNGWFDEETGIPILLRVDYDPDNHTELVHSRSHFVISNLKDCRIPMNRNLTLVKFVQLILNQVYNNYEINLRDIVQHDDEITKIEKGSLHINS